MHKIERHGFSIFFAKLLIFFSFALIVSGIFINYNYLDPIKDFTSLSDEKNTVSVTPIDSEDDTLDNSKGENISNIEEPVIIDSTPSNNNPISSGNSNQGGVINNPSDNIPSNSNQNVNFNSTTSEEVINQGTINDNLRKEIQDRFGIVVKYGEETAGYSVNANGNIITTTPISNDTLINEALNNLKSSLSLYPNGFFQEIRQGGIPLTVYLINNYSEIGVTGITDSSYTYANISIAVKYPFGESFFHESYHYIERYMFKKGAVFYNWDSLNPQDFVWNVSRADLSYSNTKNPYSFFVNNYAQTSEEEDRASTFEYMMDSTRASCFTSGSTILKKARWMAENIDAVFNTVSPNVIDYWERYLDL